jgi:type VI secretion system secreted protein VgrG
MPITQDKRVAKLETALGGDVLGLARFEIDEGLGELFEWHLEAFSEQANLDFDSAIGRPCSIKFKTYDTERLFHGVLAEARWIGIKGQHYIYKLEVVPWLWLLSRVTNCRIFEEKSVPDIIQEVFQNHGFTDFRMNLSESHPQREYCVQYRETDLNFVLRLIEEEGIVFYFEHTSDKHTMVMVDSNSAYQTISNRSTIPWVPSLGADWPGREHLSDWHKERSFRSGKVVLNDYNFKQPNSSLKAEKEAAAQYNRAQQSELYDHPGNYKERSLGERFAKVRLEAEQAMDHRRYGSGEAITLYPGGLVTLEKHHIGSENTQYLVVRAMHTYVNEDYASAADAINAAEAYSGRYEFLPSDKPFRNLIMTPKPRVYGMHTAKVVGPSGEEIHVDEHGRIRVEFFWDRDKSQSRWTRVAQLWAGKEWGFQYIPRIGMEVVVIYEEGDPDHPIVIGAVYNGDNKYPYSLPGNKTQSGVKSNSSKGGNGYNEFMFEDKKGQELVRMHAQKDYDVTVHHVETRTIGEDMVQGASRSTTLLSGDDELTIAMGSQTETIARDRSVTIGMNDTSTVGVSISTTAGASISTTAGASISTMAGASISTTAGASISETAGASITVMAGASITIMAGAQITLIGGGSVISINPAGVQIAAPTFAVAAPGGAIIKGATIPLVS